MLHTTLELCKKEQACSDGYKKLIKSLPKDHKKTDHITLKHIVESNGIEDAIWALRATVEESKDFYVRFSIWCARQSLQYYESEYPNDTRVKDCIDCTEKYINDEATKRELQSAALSAWSAAESAWSAARYPARYAARSAEYAAWSAARYPARCDWSAALSAESAALSSESARSTALEAQKEKFLEMLKNHSK